MRGLRDRLTALVEELGAENAMAFQVDVSDRDAVKAFVDRAAETFGRIDVMINNAGVMPLGPLEAMRFVEWDRCIDVNTRGCSGASPLPCRTSRNRRPGNSSTLRPLPDTRSIPASSFARCVLFAMGQPEEVDINEVLFRPTSQEL
ncbi:NADP-dependent 3-hydroxy acid dehydrogenase YdfG [Rhodobium gokarnense]|uniref:NADP-dependent 3-hydroxy acid dehydrogenase YdfG n=1 Tax=Rhodobium gokarnense TaxID=364296 RepID=A0ABT3HEY8_9HYPH|nr:SDR family NAD(P)-dependent oxidoreductase [Rhodobium gokarnense]MCW2308962.1 NADP-dependent 3-hydroxy acid dehydrogenase YdfG [Rhodobium gokarnense]